MNVIYKIKFTAITIVRSAQQKGIKENLKKQKVNKVSNVMH